MANDEFGVRYGDQFYAVGGAQELYDLKTKFFTEFSASAWATIWIGKVQLLVTPGVPVAFIGLAE